MCPLRSGGVSFPFLLLPLPKQSVSGRLHPPSLSPRSIDYSLLSVSPSATLFLPTPAFAFVIQTFTCSALFMPSQPATYHTLHSPVIFTSGKERRVCHFCAQLPNVQLLVLLIYFTKYPSYFCQNLTCHTAALSSFKNRLSLLLKVTHSPSLFFALSIALSQTLILCQRKSILSIIYKPF